jgi:hypothetical protein
VELVVGKAVASARSEAGLRGVFVEVVGVVAYGMSVHDGLLVFRHWEVVVAVVSLALIVAIIFLIFHTPITVLEKSIQGNIHLVDRLGILIIILLPPRALCIIPRTPTFIPMPTPIVESHLATNKAKTPSTQATHMIAPILQLNATLTPRTNLIVHTSLQPLKTLDHRRLAPRDNLIAFLLIQLHKLRREEIVEVFDVQFFAAPAGGIVGVILHSSVEDRADAELADHEVVICRPGCEEALF